MFNQHHTHYMSSSKIIPCSCKGNVITSKSWETQWHECIDRKNKVCSRYLILYEFECLPHLHQELSTFMKWERRLRVKAFLLYFHSIVPDSNVVLSFPACSNVRTTVPEPHMWWTTPLTRQNSHIWHPEKENIRGWAHANRLSVQKHKFR